MWNGLPINQYFEEYNRFKKDAFILCVFFGVVIIGVGLILSLTLL